MTGVHGKNILKGATVLTLDASIFVRRASPNDSAYAVCRDLFDTVQMRAILLYEPLLVLPEVAGAVSRVFRDSMRGRIYADVLRSLPNVTYVPIDADLSREAEEIAADYFLRGADATYVAIARRYNCALVSLDEEHRRRVGTILTVYTPGEALAAI